MITIDSCSVSFLSHATEIRRLETLLKAERERDTAAVTVGDL